jgi:dolichyl-phosphate beta-glucosyltransferase
MKLAQVSVVIPAYNEEKVIGQTIARVARYLEQTEDPELIVVDDGSRDATRAIVQGHADRFPFLRLVALDRNGGKGKAVQQGVLASRGRWVAYTDADLVYPVEGVEPFIAALEAGADVALGSRSHPETLFLLHPRHFSYIHRRYLVGRLYIWVVNSILGLGVTDTQCGFKVFRGEVARTIFARTTLFDFAYEVEALFIARQLGCRLVEMPVRFLYLGEQSSVQLVKDGIRMLYDLWKIRRNGAEGRYLPSKLAVPGDPADEVVARVGS